MYRLRQCLLVLATGLLLVAVLLLAMRAAAQTPQPPARAGAYGGNFRFPTLEPLSLDPIEFDGSGPDFLIGGQVYEGLTRWDDNFFVQPALAQSWSSPDARVWTFIIRPGARFHNGRQVVAEDVVFSWQRLAASGNEWYGYMLADLIDEVSAVAPDTVEVSLSEPFALFPELLPMPIMAIVPEEAAANLATQPVGAGPFHFVSWTPGQQLAVEAFDDYFSGRPFLDQITFKFFPDADAMLDAFLLGNVEYVMVPDDRLAEVAGDPHLRFVSEFSLCGFWMKTDRPPLDDTRVRRALNHAANLPDILANDVATDILPIPAQGMVSPGMQAYDPPMPAYPYSPTLALDLLADAGWSDTNGDLILDDGMGNDLALELWYPTDRPGREALFDAYAVIAESLAEDWSNIGGAGLGATVVITHTAWADYFGMLDELPLYALQWWLDYPSPENILSPLARPGAPFYGHYDNPQVRDWMEQALVTQDLGARQALFELAEEQIALDVPVGNAFHLQRGWLHAPDVLGMTLPEGEVFGQAAIQMERVQLVQYLRDIALDDVLYPKPIAPAGPLTPTIRVRNAGLTTESGAPLSCRILPLGGQELYNDTAALPAIAPSQSLVIAFAPAPDLPPGEYRLACMALLAGDENPANDALELTFEISDTADGYTRDHPADSGATPTQEWWQSPDIVVRHAPDNIHIHQQPILGQTNYVYVRVRNIGGATLQGGEVNVYWHEPSSAILCDSWAAINGSPMPVAPLPAGEWQWLMTTWTPPIEGHTCLFSTFSAAADPVTAACDVSWDNNIAQRNVEVVPLDGEAGALLAAGVRPAGSPAGAQMRFDLANIYDVSVEAELTVRIVEFPPGGQLLLELGDGLFQRWLAAGGGVVGGEIVAGSTMIALTGPAEATVFGLPLDPREAQRLRLVLTAPAGGDYRLDVRQLIDGLVVGGMSYLSALPGELYLPVMVR